MKTKAVTVLLAVLLAAQILTGCSETPVNSEPDTPEGAELSSQTPEESAAEEAPEEDSRLSLPDNLPEADFGGKEFRVITEGLLAGFDYTTEITVEELNGDTCNDAVYNRNVKIEDRFNTKMAVDAQTDAYTAIITLAQSGSTEYQLVGIRDHCAQTPIRASVLLNWLEIPHVDLSQPWHIQLANDDATVNGKLFAIASDLSITSMVYTYATYCNTDAALDYGYSSDSFYSSVKEGTWTIDRLIELSDTMYVDLNGDGAKDKNDRFGYGYCVVNPADVWATAFGERSFNFTENSSDVSFPFGTEKMADVLTKLVDWHYNHAGFYKMNNQYEEENMFADRKVVLAPLRLLASFTVLREMEDTYIILPYPKWEEAQEGYYTNADDKFSNFGVPVSVADDVEFIGTVYEALCAESYKTVYPAYYDTALKGRYSSDPTTAEMVDLIMDGRAFDFGAQFYVSYYYKVRDLINEQNSDAASHFAETQKQQRLNAITFFNKCYGTDIAR